ncbi:hypothetical protein, partial [Allomesorhizobium camelthorni]|uniref:hypothetical protein n=1 Tax=Allomesorhizobium camelthorni TaxID=475069 RepID=UPI00197DE129
MVVPPLIFARCVDGIDSIANGHWTIEFGHLISLTSIWSSSGSTCEASPSILIGHDVSNDFTAV